MTQQLCECGCGAATPPSKSHDPARGYIKGQPLRFVPGHQIRVRLLRGVPSVTRQCLRCGVEFHVVQSAVDRGGGKYCSMKCRPYAGPGSPAWRGGRITLRTGRTLVYAPDHPNATLYGGKYVFDYWLVATETLGRPLRKGEVVHHINGDHTDNRPENLEVVTSAEHARRHNFGKMLAPWRFTSLNTTRRWSPRSINQVVNYFDTVSIETAAAIYAACEYIIGQRQAASRNT